MDPAYAAAYPELFARHWWWRARERFLLRRFARILPADGRRRILDVGCGDGLLLDRLTPWGHAEGIEPDATTLGPGAAHRKIHLGPFDASFRPDAPFDLVLFLDVIEHLDDPVAALTRARELLTPGGRIFVSVPAFAALWTSHDDLNHHRRRYTKSMLRIEAVQAGLTVTWARYGFLAVGLAKVLVRLKERLLTSAPKPPALPPGPLNAVARAVAEVDLAVAEVVPYPFGSSLFATLEVGG
ncbi:MAG TPA: class I SAM-dependent methyltransferase [Gemmatimonadales bacterium]|nr:class I SAM-dependent methyltransferase [Gemmatimonadales bacterium]